MFIRKEEYKRLISRIEALEMNYYKDKYELEINKLEDKYNIEIIIGLSHSYFEIFKENRHYNVYIDKPLTSYENVYYYVKENLEKEIRNVLWKGENK